MPGTGLDGDTSATARLTIDLSAPEAELAASQSAAKKAPAILVSSATNPTTRTDVPAVPPPGLQLTAGFGFTVPDTDNPPVGLAVDLLGADPVKPVPVAVSSNLPYALAPDVHTPVRVVGFGATYRLPTTVIANATIGASFGIDNFGQNVTGREGATGLPNIIGREGAASLKITF